MTDGKPVDEFAGRATTTTDEAIHVCGVPEGGRVAVLAPGGSSNISIPILTFASDAARRRGASVHRLGWGYRAEDLRWEFSPVPAGRVPDRVAETVRGRVTVALTELAAAGLGSPVILGKSLGSVAAPVVADWGAAAVWFTPLLTDPATVAAMRRTDAPFLLVGGTADHWWDGDVARSVTPYVVEVPGADHALAVAGPLAGPGAVLGGVMTVVERFLDDVVWPPASAGGRTSAAGA
jgi:predicted alpha/beta-hydrolase family hydrolase